MLHKLFTLLMLIVATHSIGQTTTAQNSASNNWSDINSWSNGVPGLDCFVSITIPTGVTVDVDGSINLTGCPPLNIFVNGEMHFNTGKKLFLPDGSTIVVGDDGIISSGNGNGNSNYIEIGGQVVWSAGDPDITDPVTLHGPTVLGVGLTSYYTTLTHGNNVVIEWETYFETNNSHFEIERKLGSANWTTIDIVNGGMDTENSNYYRSVDYNLANGQYYYRVTQFDNDGQSTIFGIKSIKIGDEAMYIVSKYNLLGEKVGDNYSGIVIVLYSNGTTEKVFQ